MIDRISHVGVLVRDLEGTLRELEEAFGFRPEAVREKGSNRIAFIPVGGDEIELIQPADPEGRLGRYLAEHGEGVHHIALEADDIDSELLRMRGKVDVLDAEPVIGAHGVSIAFVALRGCGLVLELIEKGRPEEKG
jgi:methylmalonyl-CoA epimerase